MTEPHLHDLLRKVSEINERDEEDLDTRADDLMKGYDQQTKRALIQLKAKYPNAPNELAALLKYVARGLGHSENEDTEHDERLDELEKRVKELEKLVDLMSKK